MKKLFTFVLLLIGAMQGIYAQEPYAVLSDDNTTLTFYYDNNKDAKGGMGVGPFTREIDWTTFQEDLNLSEWYSQHDNITTVVFDESFANYANLSSTAYWFYECSNLTTITGIENLNTSNVTDMSNMFYRCSSLTNLDVSNFNTANVEIMRSMFYGCYSLTSIDLSNFNTANVTDMSYMFEFCSNLTSLDLNNFNTAKVEIMASMFDGCSSLTSLDVSNFNTAKVEIMGSMFYGCSSLTSLDVSNFNTAIVFYMADMFSGCHSLTSLDVSNFNTTKATDMSNMFSGCSGLKVIYCNDRWNCKSSKNMFTGCTSLVGAISYDGTKNDVTYANPTTGYFTKKTGETEPYAVLSDDNTTLTFYYDNNKESRSGMSVGPFTMKYNETPHQDEVNSEWFSQRNNITTVVFDKSFANYADLSSTAYWFYECSNLSTINGIENLNTENVTNMSEMFCGCSGLTSLDVSNFNTANVTDMEWMFNGCSGLTSLDVSNFNTANVTNMIEMFDGCSGLTSLDVSNFNTENVTYMFGMFRRCSELTSLDISNFNTANVTNMSEMFCGCSGLTSLDVSNFNTANVTDMAGMFWGCSGLTSLDVSKFNTANVTDMCYMFCRCSGLTSLNLSNFNTANVTETDGMFRGCSSLTSIYCNDSWTCNSSNDMFNGCTSLVGAISYDWTKTDGTYANPATGYFTYKGLHPMDDEEVSFGEDGNLNVNTDLGGTVIDNVYFNINPENGGYDAEEKCVVVSKPMTDEEIESVFGKDLLSDDVKSTFAGMVIEVPAGKGKVTVEAQTTGGMTLKVKIGSAEPIEMELEGKLKMKFPYNVTEPTYVYIYAGEASAAGSRKSGSRGNESPSLKIYGISVSTDSYLKGDANGDGIISDADVIAVKDYIMGNEPENFVFEGADANEDGKINAADIVEIVNKKK